MRQISVLQVSGPQYWISFESAAHCGGLALIFSVNNLQKSVRGLFVENLET